MKQRRSRRFDPDRAVRATFDAFVAAVTAQDFAAFRGLHTELAAAALDRERFARNAQRAASGGLRFRLLGATYEGALATVTFEVARQVGTDNERSTDTLTLVRDGERYLIQES